MGHLSYISELLAILSLSGNIPGFNTWLINRVSGLIITGAITFNNFDDISSYPQPFFVGRLFIVFLKQNITQYPAIHTSYIISQSTTL